VKDRIDWPAWNLAAATVASMSDEKLPPAEVDATYEYDTVSTNNHRIKLTAKRSGANHGTPREWAGTGQTVAEAAKDAFKQVVNDPTFREFVK
jgi:hypothetical protein